jgi:undecaprenyl-diphosphatase
VAQRVALAFQRFDAAEVKFCRYLNRSSRSSVIRQLFRAVSWLGNGWLWYALMFALPALYGTHGLRAGLHMALTGALGLALYKFIKSRAVRERP